MNKKLAVIVSSGAAVIALGGCSIDKFTEPYKDAPRSGIDDKSALVLTMPDGFSNVAAKCDGTTRVYVVYKGNNKYGSIAVSPNDPACAR